MRSVFIMTDLEGVAGVVSFTDQTFPDGRYHDHAKRLLTAEVNAAVEGLLAAGTEDVLVCDGHGPGGIWFEDLHPEAKLLHGRPITIQQIFGSVGEYDAAMIIGQHAMAGVSTSNLSHTQSSREIDSVKLNGEPIGEIAQFALYAGSFGVPLMFLSGEQDACEEAESLIEGIRTVSVKQGLGRHAAISLSAPAAREKIRAGVEQAARQHQSTPVPPLGRTGPYVLETRYYHTDTADQRAGLPGYERVDAQTVRFSSNDIREVLYRH